MKKSLFACFLFVSITAHCQNNDVRAASIADSVMMKMGGKQNWDNTHFLKWNFFGKRTLWWDKYTGNVRIEIPEKKLLIITNINTHHGHAYRNNAEIRQPDSVSYFMDRGYKIWANDSYWLIMPFKLKDPGVNLKYLGISKDSLGTDCFLLELTFNKVGVTPENKYHVYVDRKLYLVNEFDFFEKGTDKSPEFRDPWRNYQRYGNILLADDRGEGKLSDIAVLEEVPSGLFEKP
ncbi:MAG: hypothetical protein ABIQ74_09730 [Chitinophagales bacterium]